MGSGLTKTTKYIHREDEIRSALNRFNEYVREMRAHPDVPFIIVEARVPTEEEVSAVEKGVGEWIN